MSPCYQVMVLGYQREYYTWFGEAGERCRAAASSIYDILFHQASQPSKDFIQACTL